ncbi:MAG: hypothetical protein RIB47_10280 [Cyclobacteriaceae bacterium]
MLRLFVGWFLCLSFHAGLSQDISVRGNFQTDSIKIGIVVPYALTARYPKEYNVVFPDSTFDFTPFEFSRKKFTPTKTAQGISYDSVTYYLTTFEIDSVQKLALPIFIVQRNDSTQVLPAEDSIFLQQLIAHVPDTVSAQELPLKINTSYLDVNWLLNYPLLLIAGGLTIVVCVIVWALFGKRIRKFIKLRKLNKQHSQFILSFEAAVQEIETQANAPNTERALVLWKNYMEKLLSSPFSKYTTKEIFQMFQNESLARALKSIDRIIYSNNADFKNGSFEQLRQFTEDCFRQKVEELRHG